MWKGGNADINHEVMYEVILKKFRGSLESLRDLKTGEYFDKPTGISASKYLRTFFFH